MRYTLTTIAKWLRENIGRHPKAGDLMALVDGELPEPRAAKAWAHVARCSPCRESLKQLEQGLARFQDATARESELPDPEEGLQRLHAAIDAWHDSSSAGAATPSRQIPSLENLIYLALAEELAIYLGKRTATAMLERCGSEPLDAKKLAFHLEPMLSGFIGRAGGQAIITKLLLIWDHMNPEPASLGLPS